MRGTLLTLGEAARLLAVPVATVEALAASGVLPTVTVDDQVLVRREDVDRLADAGRLPPEARGPWGTRRKTARPHRKEAPR